MGLCVYVHEKFGRVPTTPLRDPWWNLGPLLGEKSVKSHNAAAHRSIALKLGKLMHRGTAEVV